MEFLIPIFILVFVTAFLIGYGIGEEQGIKKHVTVDDLFELSEKYHTLDATYYEFKINKSPVSSKAIAFVMRCSVKPDVALEHIKAIKIKRGI